MRVPDHRLRTPYIALLAAAALALLAIVALASRTHLFGEQPPPVSSATSRVVLDALLYLVIALDVLTVAFIIWALWPDDQYRAPVVKRRSLLQTMLTPLGGILLIGLILLMRDRIGGAGRLLRPPPGAGRGTPTALPTQNGLAITSHSGFDWIAFAIVALILAAAGAWLFYLHRRSRRRAVRQRRRLAAEMELAVTEGLEDLVAETDPRRAVIAAYARMERVLATHGHPRRPSDAPFEYVERLLGRLELDRGLVARLTELFESAKFSTHPIDAAMRDEALAALEEIRAVLRARAAAAAVVV